MVSVTEFLSQPIYLLGEFNKPGVFYMDRPFSLVQALGLAAGMTDRAYLPGARLIRRNEILPVDVFALLREGDFDNNIWMKPGDTIYVPAIDDLDVLVLGAVQNPGAQPFMGTTSVLEAISQAGGHTAGLAELKNTRVIRTHSPIEGEMMVIDVIDIFKARAPDYRLSPGDIVYIPETVGGNWNELVEDIIPSLSQMNGLDRVVEFELIFNPSN